MFVKANLNILEDNNRQVGPEFMSNLTTQIYNFTKNEKFMKILNSG